MNKKLRRAGDFVQRHKCLLCKHEVLSSITDTQKKKKSTILKSWGDAVQQAFTGVTAVRKTGV